MQRAALRPERGLGPRFVKEPDFRSRQELGFPDHVDQLENLLVVRGNLLIDFPVSGGSILAVGCGRAAALGSQARGDHQTPVPISSIIAMVAVPLLPPDPLPVPIPDAEPVPVPVPTSETEPVPVPEAETEAAPPPIAVIVGRSSHPGAAPLPLPAPFQRRPGPGR